MTDILDRLKDVTANSSPQTLPGHEIWEIFVQSRDEIERLRDVLKHLYNHGYTSFSDHDMVKAALGISDDAA
jgi:alkyl sulfatase BDS1-like metallo-beta-lactamase superfamily hydrolase